MQTQQAMNFCSICRFATTDYKNGRPQLLLFVAANRTAYKRAGITPEMLRELERLGLVECDFNSEYVYKNKQVLRTGNKILTIYGDPDNDHKIKAGNVNFTKDGQLLYSAIDGEFKAYRRELLDFAITKFQRRNCRVLLNDWEV